MIRKKALRPHSDFSDAVNLAAKYFKLYSKAVDFTAPWISRNRGKTIPFDTDALEAHIKQFKEMVPYRAYTNFVDAVEKFVRTTKGSKALITPSVVTHCSAQFPSGTFTITKAQPLSIRDGKAVRTSSANVFAITFSHLAEPVYIEDLSLHSDKIKFIIMKPKIGKLGTPSVSDWEVMLFTEDMKYDINHVDSTMNPRYAGVM